MSVMAMCFAGLSFICILPSLSYPRTFKRFGLCFTGISTVCSVVLAAVWTTGEILVWRRSEATTSGGRGENEK
jgi:hypothetical protein